MTEEGVNGLSLAEVARRLGVQPPSLYKYFPSLMAIYDALFLRGQIDNLAEMRRGMAGAEPGLPSLIAGLEASGRWLLANRAVAELLFWRPVPSFHPSEEAFAPSVEMVELQRACAGRRRRGRPARPCGQRRGRDLCRVDADRRRAQPGDRQRARTALGRGPVHPHIRPPDAAAARRVPSGVTATPELTSSLAPPDRLRHRQLSVRCALTAVTLRGRVPSFRQEGALVRRHRIAGPVAFIAAGVMWLGLDGRRLPLDGVRRHAGARRAQLPHVPRRQRVEHAHRRTCRSTRTARPGWPAWMPRRRTSIPTSGPRTTPPIPTACPTPWCRRHSPRSRSRSSTPTRATPGRTRSARARRSKAGSSRPATATPSWSTRPRAPSTSSGTRGTARRARRPVRAPSGISTRTRCARRGGRRPTPRACRSCPGLVRYDEVQSGVITHAIRMTAEATDTSYLWPARHEAGTSSNPNLPADGGPLPAQGQLQHLGLLAAGAGRPARHAAVRADPGRQRVQLVLRRDGGRQLARRTRQRAQGGPGQRLRGGRRVAR